MSDPERPLTDVLLEELDALRHGTAPHCFRRAWQLLALVDGGDRQAVVNRAVEYGLVKLCEIEKTEAAPAAGARHLCWANPTDGSEMIWIPPGPFCIGLHKEPARCEGFSLARFPVTNAQFAKFRLLTDYVPPADHPE